MLEVLDGTVHPMVAADIDAVASIGGASLGSAHWDVPMLVGELERSWAHLWVTRATDGTPRAFIATWLVQDELHILNIATDGRHRRSGHARALLTHAVGFAGARGVRHVLLEVRRSNTAAIGLYRSFGFVVMGVRARYYTDDEDALEMVLTLDPVTGRVVPGRDEVTRP